MEQYMMAEKARLFNDKEALKEIMSEQNSQGRIKKLGRKVKNFIPSLWDDNKLEIIYRGNLAKFSQNEDLKTFLLQTGDAILVEASPTDGIWGIKRAATDIRVKNPNRWDGSNYLGFALMEVRDTLKNN